MSKPIPLNKFAKVAAGEKICASTFLMSIHTNCFAHQDMTASEVRDAIAIAFNESLAADRIEHMPPAVTRATGKLSASLRRPIVPATGKSHAAPGDTPDEIAKAKEARSAELRAIGNARNEAMKG